MNSEKKLRKKNFLGDSKMKSPNDLKWVLHEPIDGRKLAYLIEHCDEYDLGTTNINGKKVDGSAQLTLLCSYYTDSSYDGTVKRSYYQHKDNEGKGYGRYWLTEKVGLQSLSRKVRHTIARDSCHDLDMANAHPVFLEHYCKTHDIDCEALSEYIHDRDDCLQTLMDTGMDRDEAKQLYLQVTNGGMKKIDRSKCSERFCRYYDNIQSILSSLKDLEPDLFQLVENRRRKSGRSLWNIEGSVVNLLMTDMENKCLMVMADVIQDAGLKIASLVFDGLMIVKTKDSPQRIESICKDCEKAIYDRYGVPVSILEKPMKEGYDLNGVIPDDYVPNVQVTARKGFIAVESLFEMGSSNYIEVVKRGSEVQYVEDLQFPTKVIAIHSSLGSGKTTAICKYIADNDIKRVLVLSPRQSFASSITREYNEKIPTVPYDDSACPRPDRFKCYLDVKDKKSLGGYDRLVISMESLHYLERFKYDLLVVDECQANLVSHVCVATNGDYLSNNFYVFESLVDECKQVVFADAFLNNTTVNYLHNREIPTTLYRYERPMTRRTCHEVVGKDLDSLLVPLVESVDNGERNYAFVSSKERAKRWKCILEQRFPDKTILCYTAGEGSNIKNVNEEWSAADVVITTSTITVGINFDVEDHFHNVFISASAKTANRVSDIFQAHYRVRHLINNRVYFHIAPIPNKNLDTSYRIIQNRTEWLEQTLCDKHPGFETAGNHIFQLAVDTQFELNVSVMYLRPLMFKFFEACNYAIGEAIHLQEIPEDIDMDVKGSEDISLAFEDIKLLNLIEFQDYERQRNSGIALSISQKVEIQKYIFTTCFATGYRLFIESEYIGHIWNLWLDHKASKMRSIKTEKEIKLKQLLLDDCFTKQAQKNPVAALNSSRNLKIQCIIDICEKLGVEHSQDVHTDIPKGVVEDVINTLKPRLSDIRHTFELRDRRKKNEAKDEAKEEKEDFRYCVGLLNSVFKLHGFTKLVAVGPDRVKKNGKRIPNPNQNYRLQPDVPSVDRLKEFEGTSVAEVVWNFVGSRTQDE